MEQVKRFCAQTSMKGLPRILKTESFFLRGLWFAAVLTFLTISLYQVYILLDEYTRYEKITTISESKENPLIYNDFSHTPEFSVCNMNALSSDLERYQGIPTPQQYYDLVLELTACENCTADERDGIEYARRELMTLSGYYRYIGSKNASAVGHRHEDFIVSCSLVFADGFNEKTLPCGDMIMIDSLQTPEYFNCYNIIINTTNPNRLANWVGISLVFHLDNYEDINQRGLTTTVPTEQLTNEGVGVLLSIHSNGKLPILVNHRHVLTPGKMFDIRLKPEVRKRLEPPHGGCDQDAVGEFNTVGYTQISKVYSFHACLLLCFEEAVWIECQCLSVQGIDLAHRLNHSLPHCGDLKQGLNNAILSLTCARKVREKHIRKCHVDCPNECLECVYYSDTTTADWPSRTKVKSFYNQYIKGTKHQGRYTAAIGDLNGTNSALDGGNAWEVLEMFRENYLKCKISITGFTHTVVEDTVKTTTEVSLSQLGGTLNLWSGISAIVGIEVLELIYELFCHYCSRNKKQEKKVKSTEIVKADLDNTEM